MNYTELKSTVAGLINRQDLSDGEIAAFIRLAEAGFNRDVRHWRMEKRAYVTAEERYLSLPPFWVETLRVHPIGQPAMDIMSRQEMQDARAATNDQPGTPTNYRHSEDNYELYPTPASATDIEVEYYQKIFSLGEDEQGLGSPLTTNWLLDTAPDIYIYGAALHSAPWLHDDARIQTWAALLSAGISSLNSAGKRAEMSGSVPRMNNTGMG